MINNDEFLDLSSPVTKKSQYALKLVKVDKTNASMFKNLFTNRDGHSIDRLKKQNIECHLLVSAYGFSPDVETHLSSVSDKVDLTLIQQILNAGKMGSCVNSISSTSPMQLLQDYEQLSGLLVSEMAQETIETQETDVISIMKNEMKEMKNEMMELFRQSQPNAKKKLFNKMPSNSDLQILASRISHADDLEELNDIFDNVNAIVQYNNKTVNADGSVAEKFLNASTLLNELHNIVNIVTSPDSSEGEKIDNQEYACIHSIEKALRNALSEVYRDIKNKRVLSTIFTKPLH